MRDFGETNVNRRYFLWYVNRLGDPSAKVLDFGCGSGVTVGLLRRAGYDASGVDIRWPGADYGDIEHSDLPEGTLRYYDQGGPLPFEDDTFDVIISDQVLEHVVPLEETVAELERVLKPGGVMYHHFPSLVLVREGHIGIPLAHRLSRGRARLYYTALLRRFGAGANKDDRSPMVWAAENLEWIDRWTVYRRPEVIEAVLGRGAQLRHREIDYCRFRAEDRRTLAWILSRSWSRRPAEWLFRRLAFEAVEVRTQTG
ncbi:MAG TPA: class I SAM-dependent methyltransferase [Solirubrobacteraceae bacterium]|nr:class I SAM-dependent methyltransferase [Solirubrobacteraceae bacterium]